MTAADESHLLDADISISPCVYDKDNQFKLWKDITSAQKNKWDYVYRINRKHFRLTRLKKWPECLHTFVTNIFRDIIFSVS